MELTQEQIAIINSTGNIKINAVAGSGKTTTIIEYARTRPHESKILYLAFNKSVKIEAIKKFRERGIENVVVETAHSLAYKSIVIQNGYRLKTNGYKPNEIVELLQVKGNGEQLTEYILANHIAKFIAYFCNSDKEKLSELNYLDVVSDKKVLTFVRTFYKYIESKSRQFLSLMDKGEIEITHDFYIKKFQLSKPMLDFDYILFDEGQDASPAMLDIFFNQDATKVIVGDTHQQIYGWRFAVNSLEKADFTNYYLTTSFRFSSDIANLAIEVLNRKKHVMEHKSIPITGHGQSTGVKTKAIIARTNLGLLLKAIEYVNEKKNLKGIYFEGNIHSYTYADDGASLYDVLHLYNGRRSRIKDPMIRTMRNMAELEQYIDKTDDVQLGMMVEIVREYGNEIPGIIKSIKDKHVPNDAKEQAEMIFSTVHRCKGMEYDSIQLVNDFITEKKLEKAKDNINKEEMNIPKINEEINLLYVALTRTRNSIHIPEALMPVEFPESKQIHVLKELTDAEIEAMILQNHPPSKTKSKKKEATEKKESSEKKAYSVETLREKHKDAYRPWTFELDRELTLMYCEGVNVRDLAKHFGRTKGSINARILKLELEDSYG